jgi:hypothetical protein
MFLLDINPNDLTELRTPQEIVDYIKKAELAQLIQLLQLQSPLVRRRPLLLHHQLKQVPLPKETRDARPYVKCRQNRLSKLRC